MRDGYDSSGRHQFRMSEFLVAACLRQQLFASGKSKNLDDVVGPLLMLAGFRSRE